MRTVLALAILSLATPAFADCPAAVKATVDKAFPHATIRTCKLEHEHGHDQYEVAIEKADHARAELDVAADGKLLQIEEVVALDQVPAAVMKAFAARYPKAKADRAEKQTPTAGAVSYELAFSLAGKRKEATFAADGKFVEEE